MSEGLRVEDIRAQLRWTPVLARERARSRLAAYEPTTKSHKRSNHTKRAGPREMVASVTATIATCTGWHGQLFLSLSVGDQDFGC